SWTVYRPGDGKFEASNVDPNLCTHIFYAFVGLNEDGTLQVLDDWEITGLKEIDHLMALKQENPKLKVIVAMGGWNEGSTKYSQVAADPERRANLVESTLEFIDQYGFDGFDLAWEFPGQNGGDPERDSGNFVTLLGELKVALQEKGLILSADVTGEAPSMDISYPDVEAVSNNVDLINVLPEDFDFNPDNPYNILGEDWVYAWDDKHQIPNKINGNATIVYEDAKSLGIKTDLAKKLGLGGAIVWTLDEDDFLGLCDDGAYPLLRSVNSH
ncbi:Glyco hydro 18 domain containing protein, partial [Asbolus verrucosus]